MAQRFSKQVLTEYLQSQITSIQKDWGFDPSNGTNQIDAIAADRMVTNRLDILGKSDIHLHRNQAWLAYGELNALLRLADEYNLVVYAVPEGFSPCKTKTLPHVTRYRPTSP